MIIAALGKDIVVPNALLYLTVTLTLLTMDGVAPVKLLWKHPRPQSTRTDEFKARIERKYAINLPDYESLRQWSLDNLSRFWEEVFDFTKIRASKPYTKVLCCIVGRSTV